MKILSTILVIVLGLAFPAFAEHAQVRFEIRYEGVDAKWLSDLSVDAKKVLKPAEGGFRLPAAVARIGETATIEVTQEYRTGKTPSGPAIPCGIIIGCSPELTESGIRLIGKGVLRRAIDKTTSGIATQFEAQEILINLDVEDGVSKSIDLACGGQMRVMATLIDAAGHSIRK